MQIAIGFLFAALCLLLSSSNSKLTKINVTSDEDLVFLKYTVQTIQDPNAFAHFGGHEIKAWLGNKATNSIVIDESKEAGLRSWKEILEAMQTSKQVTESQTAQIQALHVHNEHKIGDLFEKMQRYIRNYKKGKKKLEKLDSQDIHDMVNKAPYPFVMTNSGDENWGFLSTNIGTRTTKWINMTNHLRIHRADHQTILDFLGAEKLLLLICNTHVDPAIGAHRKVLSLPLGVKGGPKLYKRMKQIIQKKGNQRKTKLLVINNSGWGDRTKINAQVIEAFNHTVSNSYKQNNGEFVDHYEETAMAKFVLCPSGLGMDSYRLWETVALGSIPIVESNAGLDRTYASLPVLVISNYSVLTPQLLHKAYPCFLAHAHEFKYKHLTRIYWQYLIKRAVDSGRIDHVERNHPFKNKFCDFSSYKDQEG